MDCKSRHSTWAPERCFPYSKSTHWTSTYQKARKCFSPRTKASSWTCHLHLKARSSTQAFSHSRRSLLQSTLSKKQSSQAAAFNHQNLSTPDCLQVNTPLSWCLTQTRLSLWSMWFAWFKKPNQTTGCNSSDKSFNCVRSLTRPCPSTR